MTLIVTSETTLNNSNKTVTVPTGYVYEVLYCGVELTTSSDAGNRQMVLLITDDENNQIIEFPAGTVQSASTTRYYNFCQGSSHQTSFINSTINIPICDELVVPENYKIVLKDDSAIDTDGDDMTIKLVTRRLRRY